MIYKMPPSDEWQKFANLRLLYSHMFTHPGANCFYGNEFAQTTEWNFLAQELDWHLLVHEPHLKCRVREKSLMSFIKVNLLCECQFDKEWF